MGLQSYFRQSCQTLMLLCLLGCSNDVYDRKGSYSTGTQTDQNSTQGTVNPESLNPGSALMTNTKPCYGTAFRASKIAIVVDNSGSNNLTPGKIQYPEPGGLFKGTDAVRVEPREESDDGKGYTNRQLALYKFLQKVDTANDLALSKNDAWPGIEVGISSFPKSKEDLVGLQIVSGKSVSLPEIMTNLNSISFSGDLLRDLWNNFSFTHYPQGMTPYSTALRNVEELFRNSPSSEQSKDSAIIFITDGLPTDQNPSAILSLRNSLAQAKLYLISIYQPLTNDANQNTEAKTSLKKLYDDPSFNWGKSYFADFESYWKALLDIPLQIADKTYEISNSSELYETLEAVSKDLLTCQKP